jgi:pantetheine-phosphate adenylyltransferase
MARAIYALSGDPITYGHMDIIRRILPIWDDIVVVIGNNARKINQYTFSLDERTDMARRVLEYNPKVSVTSITGLLADYAYEQCVPVIIKGVRDAKDAGDEETQALVNKALQKGIETFILFADPKLKHISSSMVKEVQREQGLIHEFVPLYVKQKLEERLSGQYIVGITGEIGAGKSYIANKMVELGRAMGIPVHWIDLDKIGHQILGEAPEPRYGAVREEIAKRFGQHLLLPDGTIDRKKLGELVFADHELLHQLNGMMYEPMLLRLRRQELPGKKGLILFDAALIAEVQMGPLSNLKVILPSVDKKSQRRRLQERGYSKDKIDRRLESQHDYYLKKRSLEEAIENEHYGTIWTIDNSDGADPTQIDRLFDDVINDLDVKIAP